jgi:outer membrane receptor protein involved in Fe transport
MYELNGIQARLTYNWREQFLNAANIGNNEPEYTEDYSQVDFNVSYEFTENVTVSLEGINILGENARKFGRNVHQARRVEVYGPRYALGARYTF